MEPTQADDQKQKKVNPRFGKFVFYQVLLVVVLLWAALASGDAIARRPQTCNMCHEMQGIVHTWQNSSHEKIACVECHHKKPGYYGFILGIPDKVTDILTHLSGNYTDPIKATTQVSTEVCQKCHVSWRGVSPGGDLTVPHNLHFEKRKIQCIKCHTNVVHGMQAEGKFIRRPPMELCLSCHGGGGNNKDAPVLACKQCHTAKAMPDNHRNTVVWKIQHSKIGRVNPKYCISCHGWRPDYCNNCHGSKRPSSHVGETQWRTIHAKPARIDKTGCLVCHSKDTFCRRCHDPFTDVK